MRSAAPPPNVYEVAASLKAAYGDFDHNNKKTPMYELLFIICSLQTDHAKYTATYRALRRAFPTLQDLAYARESQISDAIAAGGLARQKAKAIRQLLASITREFGRPSLAPLRQMSEDECERFLRSLPGVGVKTARCVMMYSLDSAVFPVDTHCWRISRRLGWVRPTRRDGSCSPRDMDRLQAKIPKALRFSLHVNMVSLGRNICSFRQPRCDECPIASNCKRVGV